MKEKLRESAGAHSGALPEQSRLLLGRSRFLLEQSRLLLEEAVARAGRTSRMHEGAHARMHAHRKLDRGIKWGRPDSVKEGNGAGVVCK